MIDCDDREQGHAILMLYIWRFRLDVHTQIHLGEDGDPIHTV